MPDRPAGASPAAPRRYRDGVIFLQSYLGCLSHASYLIGDESTGRAVVVDPQRDVSGYLADAAARDLRIELVIETHFHADFLSGHLELAAATGAAIAYGELADEPDFEIRRLRDGERISLGEVTLEVRSTPGHTPESISVVVTEHPGDPVPYGVLTGDTLFIGDVGRPDLMASAGHSADELARLLYHSLHERLLDLPDATRVFPAHGAGSACGKHLSSETESTIGDQRRSNYALQPMAEDAFVAVVTEGQPSAPAYFGFSAHRNREQRPLLDERAAPAPLSLDDVLELQRGGAAVLDTRDVAAFASGHLRGSINVGLEGRFAEYAGDALRPEQRIVLVGDAGTELGAKVRLGRIGFDGVVGHLDGAVGALGDRGDVVVPSSRLTARQLADRLAGDSDLQLLDVRTPSELEAGSIATATPFPLARLLESLGAIDPDRPVVTYCASGYRSSIAASVIAASGHRDVSDLIGGYEAWKLLVGAA